MALEFTSLEELEKNMYSVIPRLKDATEKPCVENPFKSNLRLSTWDILRIPLCCVLVTARLLSLGITIATAIVTAKLFLIGYKDSSKPMVGFRQLGHQLINFYCRVCAFCCGFHYIKVKGKLDPSARILVAAPHSSFIDIFAIVLVGDHCAVTREENIQTPLLGNCVRLVEPVSVLRDQKDSKTDVVRSIKSRANSEEWVPTLIFPEATCTNRQSFIFFKPGAFYPGLPVQPIIIRYPDSVDYATWTWIGFGSIPLLLVMMSRWSNRVELEILPMYHPSQEEIDDPFLYARNVRKYVANVDGVPITDHSYEDCRLMNEARKLELPMEAGLVEYYKLSSILGMKCATMIEHLKEFARIDKNLNGMIELEEFCDYLHLPATEEVKTIFRIYDTSKTNSISFREYLIGSHMISRAFLSDVNIRAAFDMLDTLQNGYISLEDLSAFLKKSMQVEDKDIGRIFNELDIKLRGKVEYPDFFLFCDSKPEYTLLFLHFRKQMEKSE